MLVLKKQCLDLLEKNDLEEEKLNNIFNALDFAITKNFVEYNKMKI